MHISAQDPMITDRMIRMMVATAALLLLTVPAARAHSGDPVPPSFENCPGLIPEWMRASADTSFDQMRGTPRDGCVRVEPAVGGVIRPAPPTYAGAALPVPRRAVARLTAGEFYWRFLREGLPVVLTGFFDRDPAFWARHIRGVAAAARAKFARLRDERGGVPDSGGNCEGSKNEGTWCDKGVQVCGDACHAAAALPADALPAALRFDAPLSSPGQLRNDFTHPAVFWWDKDPNTFGGPLHFDIGCASSLSIHYTGVKHWHLWTPWDLRGGAVPAHTRFETDLAAGEALLFPAGYFHGTFIKEGPSFAASHFLNSMPTYVALGGLSLAQSPFGFEHCATTSAGWRAEGEVWDALVPRPPPGVLLAELPPPVAAAPAAAGAASSRSDRLRSEAHTATDTGPGAFDGACRRTAVTAADAPRSTRRCGRASAAVYVHSCSDEENGASAHPEVATPPASPSVATLGSAPYALLDWLTGLCRARLRRLARPSASKQPAQRAQRGRPASGPPRGRTYSSTMSAATPSGPNSAPSRDAPSVRLVPAPLATLAPTR